ncbi:hypothetical protein pb186bvf_015791 [Paramecium bursaria]
MELNLKHFHLYKNYLKFEIQSKKQNYQFSQELKILKHVVSVMKNLKSLAIYLVITFFVEIVLQKVQSCPICRRVCCNLLNKKFPLVGETNLVEHDHQGLPCFQYRIAIPHNSQAAFNFFEKRYVAMTTEALQKDLHFIIDPQVEGFCFKVKLLECQSYQDQQVYVCNVQNVGRYKIIQTSYREIPDSQDKLKYAEIEPVEDLYEDGCQEVFKSIEKCVDDLIEVLKENEYDTRVLEKLFPKNQELTQKYITNKSLELLAVVRIQEQAQIKLYFSSDVLGRLKTLFKHFDSFLTFYKDQPKQE